MSKHNVKSESATVIATLTRADGTTVEIVPMKDEPPEVRTSSVGPLRKQRVRKDATKAQPIKVADGEDYVAEVPTFGPDGKLSGFVTEERKTAAVLGRIPLTGLDLRRFQR